MTTPAPDPMMVAAATDLDAPGTPEREPNPERGGFRAVWWRHALALLAVGLLATAAQLMITRAFAIGSDILLLDEPFGALDALTRRQLQSLLLNVWEENRRTVVMVTHDVDEAVLLSDRIVVMSPGPEATIIEDIEVGLPRPRSGSDDSAVVERKNELRERLLGLLENG